MTCFTDSNYGGSETNGRSTTAGCFTFGFAMISSMSRKQDPVTLSSIESKYVVACQIGKKVVWLRKLLSDLFTKPISPTMINCDNQSSFKMFEDHVFHERTKHINNKYHYIRILVQYGIMKLQYVLTDEQVVDVLTKYLPNNKFEYLRSMLCLVDITDFINEKCLEET